MNSLSDLALKYKTDKDGEHFYIPHYDTHLSKFRDKRINLLEIGVGGYEDTKKGGNSLLMWRDYFNKGSIYGIDIHDKSFIDQERIQTFKGSQIDEPFLSNVCDSIGNLDIVIDDGSHINEHVIETFRILFPRLKQGGIYIIEDLQTAYWTSHGKASSVEFLKTLVDGLNHAERIDSGFKPSYTDLNVTSIHFYHNIAFIYKGKNDEKSNMLTDNKSNSHTGKPREHHKLKLSIFQNYHFPSQLSELDPGFIPNNHIGKVNQLYENQVILDIYNNRRSEWENADYVGLVSPRFHEKTNLTFEDIRSYLDSQKDLKPVYLLTPKVFMKSKSTVSDTTFKPIQKLAKAVDSYNIFPFKIFNYDDSKCKNFCNFWIARPSVFKNYVENYLKPMVDLLYTDKTLQPILELEIPHRQKEMGLSYKPHSFFLESLFPIHVDYNNIPFEYILAENMPLRRKPGVRNLQWSKRHKN